MTIPEVSSSSYGTIESPGSPNQAECNLWSWEPCVGGEPAMLSPFIAYRLEKALSVGDVVVPITLHEANGYACLADVRAMRVIVQLPDGDRFHPLYRVAREPLQSEDPSSDQACQCGTLQRGDNWPTVTQPRKPIAAKKRAVQTTCKCRTFQKADEWPTVERPRNLIAAKRNPADQAFQQEVPMPSLQADRQARRPRTRNQPALWPADPSWPSPTMPRRQIGPRCPISKEDNTESSSSEVSDDNIATPPSLPTSSSSVLHLSQCRESASETSAGDAAQMRRVRPLPADAFGTKSACIKEPPEKLVWHAAPRVDCRNDSFRHAPAERKKIVSERLDFSHVLPKVDTGRHGSCGHRRRAATPTAFSPFPHDSPVARRATSRPLEGAMVSLEAFLDMAAQYGVPNARQLFEEMDEAGEGALVVHRCLGLLLARVARVGA